MNVTQTYDDAVYKLVPKNVECFVRVGEDGIPIDGPLPTDLPGVVTHLGEPAAIMFRHDETGRIMCIDAWTVENGFEAINPRFLRIGPLFTHADPAEVAALRQRVADLETELSILELAQLAQQDGAWKGDEMVRPEFKNFKLSGIGTAVLATAGAPVLHEGDTMDMALTIRAERVKGETPQAWRKNLSPEFHRLGNAVLCWVNEGDLCAPELRSTNSKESQECDAQPTPEAIVKSALEAAAKVPRLYSNCMDKDTKYAICNDILTIDHATIILAAKEGKS